KIMAHPPYSRLARRARPGGRDRPARLPGLGPATGSAQRHPLAEHRRCGPGALLLGLQVQQPGALPTRALTTGDQGPAETHQHTAARAVRAGARPVLLHPVRPEHVVRCTSELRHGRSPPHVLRLMSPASPRTRTYSVLEHL